MMGWVFTWIPPFLLGWTAISLAWSRAGSLPEKSLKALLSLFLGLGLTSAIYFILWPLVKSQAGLIACELALTALMGLAFFYSRSPRPENLVGTEYAPEKAHWVLLTLAGLGLLLALAGFYAHSSETPYGGWDARAIWNMRARFLFRDPTWSSAFELAEWSHPDYPLLIPATLARAWQCLGQEDFAVASALGTFFTFGAALTLGLGLHLLGRSTQGTLAFLLLLGTPVFMNQGSHQEADVPLGFCCLCVCVTLFLAEKKTQSKNRLMTLAAFFCGMAGWIKNEGLLFLFAVLLGILWEYRKEKTPSKLLFLSGMLPFLVVVIHFKVFQAPANDLFEKQSLQGAMLQLQDLSRYFQIACAFAAKIGSFGSGAFLALILYAALAGFSRGGEPARAWRISRNILLLTCAGYFFVYVLTPRDLAWHLDKSLNRLLIQLWPSFIFLVMMSSRTQLSESNT